MRVRVYIRERERERRRRQRETEREGDRCEEAIFYLDFCPADSLKIYFSLASFVNFFVFLFFSSTPSFLLPPKKSTEKKRRRTVRWPSTLHRLSVWRGARMLPRRHTCSRGTRRRRNARKRSRPATGWSRSREARTRRCAAMRMPRGTRTRSLPMSRGLWAASAESGAYTFGSRW